MREFGNKFYRESAFRRGGDYSYTEDLMREQRVIKSAAWTEKYDIFLSHSSQDKLIVTNFRRFLELAGHKVYVDWIDDSDSGRDNIAPKLKIAMTNSLRLIYLHTNNSRKSVWTPWELGYFDSKKGEDFVGVLPLLNERSMIPDYTGHEYLLTYTQIGADVIDEFVKSGVNL